MIPLCVLLATVDGFHELEADGRSTWVDANEPLALERELRRHDTVELSAAPRSKRHRDYVSRTAVLWARLESGKSCARLSCFRPAPTLVVREARTVRRTALWALDRELSWQWAVRANKRLAHALGTKKKHAEMEFMFRAPGSVVGRGVAEVEFELPMVYSPAQVVGHLADAPDPDAWRDREAA